jgi:hypothetical protein
MNTQPNENLIKKLVSLAGVASVSVFLSFPAFAITNAEASGSTQLFNNQTYNTDSTEFSKNLLAQNSGGSDSDPDDVNNPTQRPTNTDGTNNTNQPSTTGGTNNTNLPSTTSGSNRVNQTSTGEQKENRRLLTGGDSVRGVNWVCLNNPNPVRCGE